MGRASLEGARRQRVVGRGAAMAAVEGRSSLEEEE